MIQLKDAVAIKVSDLKKSKQAAAFFDMFFNIGKFLAFEQHSSSFSETNEEEESAVADGDDGVVKDARKGKNFWAFSSPFSRWDRFAESEYEQMAMEEEESHSLDDSTNNSLSEDGCGSISIQQQQGPKSKTVGVVKDIGFAKLGDDMMEAMMIAVEDNPWSPLTSKMSWSLDEENSLQGIEDDLEFARREGLQVNRKFQSDFLASNGKHINQVTVYIVSDHVYEQQVRNDAVKESGK